MIAPTNQQLRSFGRCARGSSMVYAPATIDDARSVFATAARNHTRVVIRGSGHSFDSQAVHDGDTGKDIVLSTANLNPSLIQFYPSPDNRVRLGAGVTWGAFFDAALARTKPPYNEMLRLPASMQTGSSSTVAGTVAGDCLSRFSAVLGKESASIQCFTLLGTDGTLYPNVTAAGDPDLFNAVVGGLGYMGLVLEATYKLIPFDPASVAHTSITTLTSSLADLVQLQLNLIAVAQMNPNQPHAISSAWFTDIFTGSFYGGAFDSWYDRSAGAGAPTYPLYESPASNTRYLTEVAARVDLANYFIHMALFAIAQENAGDFEDDLKSFIFFMDGNTDAKQRFEAQFPPQQFSIAQQTYVLPTAQAAAFAQRCETTMSQRGLRPTETDMLFVKGDNCFMSGSYQMDGFAISFAFEPLVPTGPAPPACPVPDVVTLLQDFSVDCLAAGGRIHLVKNVYADRTVFRNMFSNVGNQIGRFESLKRTYDPGLLLQNSFSDEFFAF